VEALAKLADRAEAAAVAAAEAAGPLLRGAQALVAALSCAQSAPGNREADAARSLLAGAVGSWPLDDGASGGGAGGDWAATEALLVAVADLARQAAAGTDVPGRMREATGTSAAAARPRAAAKAAATANSGSGEDDEEDEDDDESSSNDEDDEDEGGEESASAAGEGGTPLVARASAPAASSPAPLAAAAAGRNAHAVAVIASVQRRLCGNTPLHLAAAAARPAAAQAAVAANVEGVSPDPAAAGSAEALGVAAQVAWVIQQATSPENLCLMYEGWAPWI
jgi:hypothetical protein